MIESGELRLIGTLDTTDIERGQRRVQVGFDNVQQKTKTSTGSFNSLGGSASKLVGTFATLGAIGTGALSALVLKSPQVAGAMASMKVSTQQLSMILGDEFAPIVDNVAQSYSNFVDSVGTQGTFANSAVATLSSSFKGVGKDIENLIGFFDQIGENKIFKMLFGNEEEKGDYRDKFFQDSEGNWQFNNKKKSMSEYYQEEFLPKIEGGGFMTTAIEGLNTFNLQHQMAKKLYNYVKSNFFTTDTTGANIGE